MIGTHYYTVSPKWRVQLPKPAFERLGDRIVLLPATVLGRRVLLALRPEEWERIQRREGTSYLWWSQVGSLATEVKPALSGSFESRRITIPEALRRWLDIRRGDELRVRGIGDTIEILPARDGDTVGSHH